MSSHNRWLVLAIVSSALFLIVVDMTVLYTALPRLTHDLAATASEKLWIINAYPLVVAGLLPALGTLGDRLGHKKLFLAGLVTFGLASLAAAYAPTPAVLIGARALLAVGAAMMMPATLSIIRLTFEDERERSLAIGIWASVASGGAALGPVLGGVLLEYFWWGSVFLINVPVVVAALVLGAVLLPGRRGGAATPWDPVASLQIMVGLVGLAYAIKELSKRLPSYEAALAAAAIGAVALVLFVRRQHRSVAPLIDFSLFRDRGFASGVLAALVASVALVGVELVLSQRLQLVLELSPLEAGLFILPAPLASFAAGPVAGLVQPRLGTAWVLWTSIALAAIGVAGLLLSYDGATTLQLAALAVVGFGLGAAMTGASSAIMASAPPHRAGMAASIEEVSYELGGAIGIAVLGSILTLVYTISLTLPDDLGVPATARDSLDEALLIAEDLSPAAATELVRLARAAFDQAFLAVLGASAALLFASAAALRLMSARRGSRASAVRGERARGEAARGEAASPEPGTR